MEKDTGEMLIVLEEQRKPLDRILSSNREFRKKFTSRLEVPIFVNDELVTFGQTYAQRMDTGSTRWESCIVQPYRCTAERRSRSDSCRSKRHYGRGDGTFAEGICKKLVKRVLGKNTDDADRIILTEKDFNI